LLLRILAEEWYFWVGVEWRWNLFDTILVLSMLTDTVLVLIGLDMSYIRLLRLLRALRSFRIIRVLRFFRELRVMLLSIMNSIAPLLWAIVFLALTIGVFSIVFLQGVTSFIHDVLSSNVSIEGVRTYYSSFPMASFSLFMAITGGDDWWNLVRPLLEISEVYAVLFVLYISLMVLGVMNIITGIFVESRELRKLFMELDTNRDGTITLQEFESFAARADVQAYFSVLELDITKLDVGLAYGLLAMALMACFGLLLAWPLCLGQEAKASSKLSDLGADGLETWKSGAEGRKLSEGTFEWIFQKGTSQDDRLLAAQVDSSGDIVVAGHSTGSFEGYTSAGDYDFVVMKLSGAGTLQWIFQTGTTGTDHAEAAHVDSSGNIVLAGHSTGSFEGHANAGDYDMVVIKLSNSGTLQWIFQTGTNAVDNLRAVQVESSSEQLPSI
ncbi:CACNA1B, partial [Symbiodinium necroappetens]